METIASEVFAKELARFIAAHLPSEPSALLRDEDFLQNLPLSDREKIEDETSRKSIEDRCKTWTYAVQRVLSRFALTNGRKWEITPKHKPYGKEYLCDFTLFEEGYGCRIACESQWDNGSQSWAIDWAFDKLRGVKSDVKLLVYEGPERHFATAVRKHLSNYAQLGPDEVYLALGWKKPKFEASYFHPHRVGIQEPIFQEIPLY